MYNSKIGKEYKSCTYAVSDLNNEYDDIFDFKTNGFVKNGNEYNKHKNKLVEINRPIDNCLVCFFDKKDFMGHIGIFKDGYIYHYLKQYGLVAQEEKDALLTSRYISVKYYKKEGVE